MKKSNVKPVDKVELVIYAQLLEQIKNDVFQTQLKTVQSITKELTLLYWRIGKTISEKMNLEGYGAKVVHALAHDLEIAFP